MKTSIIQYNACYKVIDSCMLPWRYSSYGTDCSVCVCSIGLTDRKICREKQWGVGNWRNPRSVAERIRVEDLTVVELRVGAGKEDITWRNLCGLPRPTNLRLLAEAFELLWRARGGLEWSVNGARSDGVDALER